MTCQGVSGQVPSTEKGDDSTTYPVPKLVITTRGSLAFLSESTVPSSARMPLSPDLTMVWS